MAESKHFGRRVSTTIAAIFAAGRRMLFERAPLGTCRYCRAEAANDVAVCDACFDAWQW